MMTFKHIEESEISNVLELLRQDVLKNPEGKYHDADWIGKLINQGYAMGGYVDNIMVSCIIGEELIDNGIMIWFLAVLPDKQGQGYGTRLLAEFEKFLIKIKKIWIFLNATSNSASFYNKNKYITSEHSFVQEHLKLL